MFADDLVMQWARASAARDGTDTDSQYSNTALPNREKQPLISF